jgi:DNA polymerase-3 subunit delta
MAKGQRLAGYLLVGTDAAAREARLAKYKTRVPEELADFNLDEIEASAATDPAALLGSLNQMPFMAEFRMVVVRKVENLAKPASEALVAYLADPNPSTILVAEAEKLAKGTRLYKAFAKLGKDAIVEFAEPKGYKLPGHVVQMARGMGRQIDESAAQELIFRVGESTVMLENQLRSLSELLPGQTRFSREDVERYVARTVVPTPWEFVDVVAARNLSRALELFGLMPEGNYVLLHSLLYKKLKDLICAKSLAAAGRSGQIASELGKQAWQTKNLASWAGKYAPGELEQCLVDGVEVEKAVKGSADARTALVGWVVEICTGRRMAV